MQTDQRLQGHVNFSALRHHDRKIKRRGEMDFEVQAPRARCAKTAWVLYKTNAFQLWLFRRRQFWLLLSLWEPF